MAHVHKFRRHTFKTGNTIYFCAMPDCNIKIKPALTVGKKAICWRCGKEFIMTDYSVRLAKPHCPDCHQPKESTTVPANLMSDSTPPIQSGLIPFTDLRSRLNSLTRQEAVEDDEDI